MEDITIDDYGNIRHKTRHSGNILGNIIAMFIVVGVGASVLSVMSRRMNHDG